MYTGKTIIMIYDRVPTSNYVSSLYLKKKYYKFHRLLMKHISNLVIRRILINIFDQYIYLI